MYISVNSQNASDSHCTTPKITEVLYSPFEAVRMDMSMLNVNFQMAINIWLSAEDAGDEEVVALWASLLDHRMIKILLLCVLYQEINTSS